MLKNDIQKFTSFDELGLNNNLLKGIYSYGFEKPSKIQEIAIKPFVNKNDIIAQSQSGTGKTGSFLISTIELLLKKDNNIKNEALIIAPTRELAIQINNVTNELIKYTDLKSNVFIGGTTVNYNNDNNISIGTPGRIFDLLKKRILPSNNIEIIV